MRRARQRRRAWATLAIPALLAVATTAGLACGLVGDGGYDVAAAGGLALPLLAVGWGLLRSRGG